MVFNSDAGPITDSGLSHAVSPPSLAGAGAFRVNEYLVETVIDFYVISRGANE